MQKNPNPVDEHDSKYSTDMNSNVSLPVVQVLRLNIVDVPFNKVNSKEVDGTKPRFSDHHEDMQAP